MTSIVETVVEGIGKLRYMKGSNLIDIFLQTGHVSVDFNWPYIKINIAVLNIV